MMLKFVSSMSAIGVKILLAVGDSAYCTTMLAYVKRIDFFHEKLKNDWLR